jgi:hypothetical protein
MRVFAMLLFVYSVNYAPAHLALETHLGPVAATAARSDSRTVSVGAPEHDDAAHHTPHLASDHLLRVIPQAGFNFVSFDVCLVSVSPEVFSAQPCLPRFLMERQNPPGLPPPDPFQPRAPPLA